MSRGKGLITARGNSLMVDFYYQGERFRATIPGLSAHKKAHLGTAESILTQIQADIAKGTFNLADYFPNHPKAARFRKGISISECLEQWVERKPRTTTKSTGATTEVPLSTTSFPFLEICFSQNSPLAMSETG